jgi:PII-like signaling protein
VTGPGAVKLTVFFGERDRAARDVMTRLAAGGLRACVLLRGVEGFHAREGIHTDRLLSASERLPLVAVGVGPEARVGALGRELRARLPAGLVLLERARLDAPPPSAEVRLTAWVGRGRARDGLLGLLRERGLAGGTALLGVDGAVDGVRRRAGFLRPNREVPLMTVAVGDRAAIADAAAAARERLGDPPLAFERVRVCRVDGRALAAPTAAERPDDRLKVIVHARERAHAHGAPLHVELVRRLREAGAAHATALRGVAGFHGDHAPRGERLLALRRDAPILTVAVDTPDGVAGWWPTIEELTAEVGLVTVERVPA